MTGQLMLAAATLQLGKLDGASEWPVPTQVFARSFVL
jgi:hypothetical protein